MKKTTKTRDLILSLLLAAAVCALLGWYQADTSAHSYAISIIERSAIYAVVAVAMNLLNGRAADQPEPDETEEAKLREEMLEDITAIVENHFRCIVNRSGFNYSRYATHLQYLFVRIRTGQAIQSENLAMYHTLREEYPDVAACVAKIADHIQQEWGCTLTEEEQLYLILHVNRICIKEGL